LHGAGDRGASAFGQFPACSCGIRLAFIGERGLTMEDAMRSPIKSALIGFLLFEVVLVLAAGTQRGFAAQRTDATVGQQLFVTYCASCHGTEGSGNGPVSTSMRHAPPDITGLALANGGMFPAERIRRIIDGREVESHGTREMPVWGDAFKALPDGRAEQSVRARIAAVVEYLASIQRRRG
jgi:mono/diheme cytochrome c family protein